MTTCKRCGAEYPTTPEYWVKDARCRNGLRSVCLACEAARMRQYRKDNPHITRVIQRRSYRNNQERVIAYRALPEVKARHRDEVKDWKERNPEKRRSQARRCNYRRRQIERNYDGDVMTDEQWVNILQMQVERCACCASVFTDSLPATVDHIIPISKGGALAANNVQALCMPCNSKKKDTEMDYRWQVT